MLSAGAHTKVRSGGHVPSGTLSLPRMPCSQGAGLRARAASYPSAKRRRLQPAAAAAIADPQLGKYMLKNGLVDLYEVLGVDDDAPPEEIKRAYRALAKECHPDYHPQGHNICILLNEAYETLMDAGARAAYNAKLETALADEDDNYTGEPLSKWMPSLQPCMAKNMDPAESRGVFVDENTCIGCKQCVWHAPATFRIEEEWGRSRVFAQWLDTEDKLQDAIDSCPVSCIHWVDKSELPVLEYVMQNRVERVNVGVMMAGQGMVADVFAATASFQKERRRKEEEQLRAKRAYSPQQEEARRKATEQLAKEHLGFFASFFTTAMNQMATAVNGSGEDLKVGARKRSQRWQQRAAEQDAYRRRAALGDVGGADYFLVPPDRALVPVTVYQEQEYLG